MMMITMQGEHGELSPHHGVKTAKLNIWIRVLLLDGLANSCKARFPTAGEIARAKRLCRHTLADVYIYIYNYRLYRFGLMGLISVVLMSRMKVTAIYSHL